ncbi:MAG: NUDIX hydrolase [Lachnospiraceae bacterium]|nr:NUDIX hydrolase [Lachnospiraceae bacterium]
MSGYKRVGRELIHKGAIVELYKDKMQLDDGSVHDWDFIRHPGAAAVVPVDKDGNIIMVRQYRNALGRYTIELPAGGKNPDEDFETCALRELEEETGFKAGHHELLCDIFTTVALMDERIPIYLATDLVPTKQHLDEDEFLNVEKHSIDELLKMIYEGRLQDSKTICGILTYVTKYGIKSK